MKRSEYEQRLEALELEIAALKQENVEDGATPEPPHPRWEPKREELYYTIDIGHACAGLNTWDSYKLDGDIYSLGFVFQTEADAEFTIERLRVLAEIREWSGNWDDPWRIVYTPPFIVPMEAALKRCSAGELRFATKADAENCIKAVGEDRLIKYYFGVRDHEITAENE